jgi:hypothetical protein
MSGGSETENRCGMSLMTCPECSNVASIEWETWIGDVLHLKLWCVNRHWFLMPAERITCYGTDAPYLSAQASGMTLRRDKAQTLGADATDTASPEP